MLDYVAEARALGQDDIDNAGSVRLDDRIGLIGPLQIPFGDPIKGVAYPLSGALLEHLVRVDVRHRSKSAGGDGLITFGNTFSDASEDTGKHGARDQGTLLRDQAAAHAGLAVLARYVTLDGCLEDAPILQYAAQRLGARIDPLAGNVAIARQHHMAGLDPRAESVGQPAVVFQFHHERHRIVLGGAARRRVDAGQQNRPTERPGRNVVVDRAGRGLFLGGLRQRDHQLGDGLLLGLASGLTSYRRGGDRRQRIRHCRGARRRRQAVRSSGGQGLRRRREGWQLAGACSATFPRFRFLLLLRL